MNKVISTIVALVLMAVAISVSAASYPFTNPVYIPNAIQGPTTLSAPGSVIMNVNGLGTIAVEVTGTCTGLAATVQGSGDGSSYFAQNVWPVATGVIASAVSIVAVGTYRVDAAGMNYEKLAISALTASCTVIITGTPAAFTGAY